MWFPFGIENAICWKSARWMSFWSLIWGCLLPTFNIGVLSMKETCWCLSVFSRWNFSSFLFWIKCSLVQCHFFLPLQPNMTGPELDKLRAILLRHCDVNKDGKIQRNELALCLGVKTKPWCEGEEVPPPPHSTPPQAAATAKQCLWPVVSVWLLSYSKAAVPDRVF